MLQSSWLSTNPQKHKQRTSSELQVPSLDTLLAHYSDLPPLLLLTMYSASPFYNVSIVALGGTSTISLARLLALFPMDMKQGMAFCLLSPLTISFDSVDTYEEEEKSNATANGTRAPIQVKAFDRHLKPQLTIQIPTPPLHIYFFPKEKDTSWVKVKPLQQLMLKQAWATSTLPKSLYPLKETAHKNLQKIQQQDLEQLQDLLGATTACLAIAEAACEGAYHIEAASQTAIWETAKQSAHQAATTAATCFFNQFTVSYALKCIQHLIKTKWTHATNPIESWELQSSSSSSGWTYPNPSNFTNQTTIDNAEDDNYTRPKSPFSAPTSLPMSVYSQDGDYNIDKAPNSEEGYVCKPSQQLAPSSTPAYSIE